MRQPPKKTGTFLGLPYDWRRLTWTRLKQRIWNPDDRHIFTPQAYGWGFTVNLHEIGRRLGLIGRRPRSGAGR